MEELAVLLKYSCTVLAAYLLETLAHHNKAQDTLVLRKVLYYLFFFCFPTKYQNFNLSLPAPSPTFVTISQKSTRYFFQVFENQLSDFCVTVLSTDHLIKS